MLPAGLCLLHLWNPTRLGKHRTAWVTVAWKMAWSASVDKPWCFKVRSAPQFDLRQLIRSWVIAFFDARCTLWPWPVDLESSWYVKRHVIKVCTKFEGNRAIPSWINFASFCTRCRAVTLTSWPLTFTALRQSVFKLCTEFERNRIIHGWVIDYLARFRVQF